MYTCIVNDLNTYRLLCMMDQGDNRLVQAVIEWNDCVI